VPGPDAGVENPNQIFDTGEGHYASANPVVLDLDGRGIKITPVGASDTFFDLAGDGRAHRTAWAAPGNGVLVLDL